MTESSREPFFESEIFEPEIVFAPTRQEPGSPRGRVKAVLRVAAFAAAAAAVSAASPSVGMSSLDLSTSAYGSESTESRGPRMNDALLKKADRARAFLRVVPDEPTDDGPDPD